MPLLTELAETVVDSDSYKHAAPTELVVSWRSRCYKLFVISVIFCSNPSHQFRTESETPWTGRSETYPTHFGERRGADLLLLLLLLLLLWPGTESETPWTGRSETYPTHFGERRGADLLLLLWPCRVGDSVDRQVRRPAPSPVKMRIAKSSLPFVDPGRSNLIVMGCAVQTESGVPRRHLPRHEPLEGTRCLALFFAGKDEAIASIAAPSKGLAETVVMGTPRASETI